MEGKEESLRVLRLKRKSREEGENPQAKKVTAGRRRSRRRGAEPESGSEEKEDSTPLPHYSVEELKDFIRKTKQMWHVKGKDYFCQDKFFLSATFLTMRDERGAFTPQEFYRLKKILCDLRKVLVVEDEEKRARGEVD
ncbi:hypothetical protein EYF80_045780 [Liparis tanakae]|uniref:Uncharacterized protein n=1 Tax=Liparis tanakae TaxID=230148 RepID=A0A4Z2FSV7_9TELE|nr:hypothetical protein EYF80_045780 [Liparis tanakae]